MRKRISLACAVIWGVGLGCGGSSTPGGTGDGAVEKQMGDTPKADGALDGAMPDASGDGTGGTGGTDGAGGDAGKDGGGDAGGDMTPDGPPADLPAGDLPVDMPAPDAAPDAPAPDAPGVDLPAPDAPEPDLPTGDAADTCGTAADCATGMVCRMGMCEGCLATAECDSGQACDSADMRCKPGCDANRAAGVCPTGKACCSLGQICLVAGSIGTCKSGDCVSTADCAGADAGKICIDNMCSPCGLSSQCPADQYCDAAMRCVGGCDGNPTGGGCPAGLSCCSGAEVCDIATHTCMTGECSVTGTMDTCTSGDICCDGTCETGDCCSDAECVGPMAGLTCVGHQCVCGTPGTTIYVSVSSGSNTTGTGTAGCPFKTITHALSVAVAGQTVSVEAGGYNAAAGEVFPINMKAGVTLSGEDKATTYIEAMTGGYTLQIAVADAIVENFSITNTGGGGRGVRVGTGTALTTIVRNAAVTGCDDIGLDVRDDAIASFGPGLEATSNGAEGIRVRDTAQGTFTMIGVAENTDMGISVEDDSTATIGDSTIYMNGASGIEVNGNGTLVLDTTEVLENTDEGVLFIDDSDGTLRGNTIRGNGADGVLIDTPQAPDLGTAAEAGGNDFGGMTTADNNAGTAVCNAQNDDIQAQGNMWSTCPTPTASSGGNCDPGDDVGNSGGGSIVTTGATCGP